MGDAPAAPLSWRKAFTWLPLSLKWLLAAAVVAIATAAVVVSPLVLAGPLLFAVVPVMYRWERRGGTTPVPPRLTHPVVIAAVAAAGMAAGGGLAATRPEWLATFASADAAVLPLGLFAGLALIVASYHTFSTGRYDCGMAAARAAIMSMPMLVFGLVAIVVADLAAEGSTSATVSGMVVCGTVAAAVWGVALLAPRPARTHSSAD